MSTLERLKQLNDGYRASFAVYPAIKIFSEEEIDEVFGSLPSILNLVESVIQYSQMNEPAKAWFSDELAALCGPKCEECGHDEFHQVHEAGDPDPGYACKKCGHVEWI